MGRFVTAACLVVAVLVSVLTRPSRAFCMPFPGWHPMSLSERIRLHQADAAVLAKVEAVHRAPGAGSSYPYTADLEVKCAYALRPGKTLTASLKAVGGFGGTWDCAESKVDVTKEYIVLLNLSDDGKAEVAEVNKQEGSELALASRKKKVESYFECLQKW